MLRLVAAAGLLSLGSGVRVVKKSQSRETSGSAIQRRQIMKALKKKDPTEVEKAIDDGLGGIDFSLEGDEMNQQLIGLVEGGALAAVSKVVGTVNPVLGIAFSVFCSVFGIGGDDNDSDYREKVFEHVDKMIKGAMKDYTATVRTKGLKLFTKKIELFADTPEKWTADYEDAVVDVISEVFDGSTGNCWTNYETIKEGDQCWKDWTTGDLGVAGLVTEIKFMDFVMATYATSILYPQHDDYGLIADEIAVAADLTRQHMAAWKKVREDRSYIDMGEVTGGQKTSWSAAKPSTDRLIGKQVCEVKWTTSKANNWKKGACGRRTSAFGKHKKGACVAPKVVQAQKECIDKHIEEQKKHIDELQKRVAVIMKAAANIQNNQGGFSKRPKTASCTVTKNAAISGYDYETLKKQTVLSCDSACRSASWGCKSFDWNVFTKSCNLSDKSSADVGGLMFTGAYDYYACTEAVAVTARRYAEVGSGCCAESTSKSLGSQHGGGGFTLAECKALCDSVSGCTGFHVKSENKWCRIFETCTYAIQDVASCGSGYSGNWKAYTVCDLWHGFLCDV